MDVEMDRCPLAEEKTEGRQFCSLIKGHEGPCNAWLTNAAQAELAASFRAHMLKGGHSRYGRANND